MDAFADGLRQLVLRLMSQCRNALVSRATGERPTWPSGWRHRSRASEIGKQMCASRGKPDLRGTSVRLAKRNIVFDAARRVAPGSRLSLADARSSGTRERHTRAPHISIALAANGERAAAVLGSAHKNIGRTRMRSTAGFVLGLLGILAVAPADAATISGSVAGPD